MSIVARLLLLVLLCLPVPAAAADPGVVTIADGAVRVLRGTSWYKLVPGAPFLGGDIVDVGDRSQVQIELASGGSMQLVGPATLYAASIPFRADKIDGPVELGLERGWMKFASSGTGITVRLRSTLAQVATTDATIVARAEPKSFEFFVESGAARIAEIGRGGGTGPARDAKAGEFWSRVPDKPFTIGKSAPPAFVAAMPRHMYDRLVSIASRLKGPKPQLAVDREISLPEADILLAGGYRAVYAKRFVVRLSDPNFRRAVEANLPAYPEWDRILHPDRYPAGAATPAPAAPAAAAPTPAPGAKAAPAAAPPTSGAKAPSSPPASAPAPAKSPTK